MVCVLFNVGDSWYAVRGADVAEIVPQVRCAPVTKAPAFVHGIFRCRGLDVPVLDVSAMLGRPPCRDCLSTRTILVRQDDRHGQPRLLGLLAEKVLETVDIPETSLNTAVIRTPETMFLGKVFQGPHGVVQCLRVTELLPAAARTLLFPDDDAEGAA